MESTRISRGAWRRSPVRPRALARFEGPPAGAETALPPALSQSTLPTELTPRDPRVRVGRCLCGAVRYEAWGRPSLIELCHCTDCRKAGGGTAAHYGTWPAGQVRLHGSLASAQGRSFCPRCGSHLAHVTPQTVTVLLGTLDEAASDLVPERELWTLRRAPWVPAVPGAMQFERGPV